MPRRCGWCCSSDLAQQRGNTSFTDVKCGAESKCIASKQLSHNIAAMYFFSSLMGCYQARNLPTCPSPFLQLQVAFAWRMCVAPSRAPSRIRASVLLSVIFNPGLLSVSRLMNTPMVAACHIRWSDTLRRTSAAMYSTIYKQQSHAGQILFSVQRSVPCNPCGRVGSLQRSLDIFQEPFPSHL